MTISFEPFIRTFAGIASNCVRTYGMMWAGIASIRTFVNICTNMWYNSEVVNPMFVKTFEKTDKTET